ncbi:MAG: prepilin-type N-terminal cleavage/methylation domain-containing protein [Arhodomonas sp.]|nr:prepilin-type N-terminal cleavage/methylation domain-containing protein [Arhodomonas sp.]
MSRGRGFTLVEALIALVLLAMMFAAVLLPAIQVAGRSWSVAEERIEAASASSQAARVLTRLIDGARPLNWSPASETDGFAFAGGPERLTFVTALPAYRGGGGLPGGGALGGRGRWRAGPDSDLVALPPHGAAGGTGGGASPGAGAQRCRPPGAGLTDGADEAGGEPGWMDQWQQGRFPQMVRLRGPARDDRAGGGRGGPAATPVEPQSAGLRGLGRMMLPS